MRRVRQSPTGEQLHDAYPELWTWYETRYPKIDQPRRSLLMLEFVRRSSWLCLLAEKASQNVPGLRYEDPSDLTFDMVRAVKALRRPSNGVQEFRELDADVEEILTYLARPFATRSDEDLVRELSARGFSALEIHYLLPRLTNRVAGHPVTARLDTVKAADLFDAGYSWNRIARKLHSCTDAADYSRKGESIRKSVKSLDKLFHKFGIPIPERKARA